MVLKRNQKKTKWLLNHHLLDRFNSQILLLSDLILWLHTPRCPKQPKTCPLTSPWLGWRREAGAQSPLDFCIFGSGIWEILSSNIFQLFWKTNIPKVNFTLSLCNIMQLYLGRPLLRMSQSLYLAEFFFVFMPDPSPMCPDTFFSVWPSVTPDRLDSCLMPAGGLVGL